MLYKLTSFFFILKNVCKRSPIGSLGIGTTSPGTILDISASDASPLARLTNLSSTMARFPAFRIYTNGAENGGSAQIFLSNARGSSGSNTAAQTNDNLGEVAFNAHNGTAIAQGARVLSLVDGNWSSE